MLSQAQRAAILELSAKGVTKREIARVTVRKVLQSNSTNVPEIQRAEKAEPYRQQILDLLISCKGNLVRVHEELAASGAALSYPALTAFCRRQGIGQKPVLPAGQYHFEPGLEMQHDTSPHEVEVGGRKYKAQTASAVLCYSRMLFFQISPTFQRFDCKIFLTDALRYMGGAASRVMIDNTHVVVLRGTGREISRRGSGATRSTPLTRNISARCIASYSRSSVCISNRCRHGFPKCIACIFLQHSCGLGRANGNVVMHGIRRVRQQFTPQRADELGP